MSDGPKNEAGVADDRQARDLPGLQSPADIYAAPSDLPDHLHDVEPLLDRLDACFGRLRLSLNLDASATFRIGEGTRDARLNISVDEFGTAHVELAPGAGFEALRMHVPLTLVAGRLGWNRGSIAAAGKRLDVPSAIGVAKAVSKTIRSQFRHASMAVDADPDFLPRLEEACDKANAIAHAHDYWGLDTGAEIFVDLPTPRTPVRFEAEDETHLSADRPHASILPTVLRLEANRYDGERHGDPIVQSLSVALRPVIGFLNVPDPIERLRAETRDPHVVALRASSSPPDSDLLG